MLRTNLRSSCKDGELPKLFNRRINFKEVLQSSNKVCFSKHFDANWNLTLIKLNFLFISNWFWGHFRCSIYIQHILMSMVSLTPFPPLWDGVVTDLGCVWLVVGWKFLLGQWGCIHRVSGPPFVWSVVRWTYVLAHAPFLLCCSLSLGCVVWDLGLHSIVSNKQGIINH